MIRNQDQLALVVAHALKSKPSYRIFLDVSVACFSGTDGVPRADEILAFAAKHGWHVEITMPGNYGLVCEFSKGEEPID